MEGTRKCPICGAPYKWYSMTVADQTACPDCVREAERRVSEPSDNERRNYARRRNNFWSN